MRSPKPTSSGIYGRQGLDFANYWIVPKPTDPVAYSFRIYRNFDGAGDAVRRHLG